MAQSKSKKLDANAAREILQQELEQARQSCLDKIQAILDAHNMMLVVNTILTHDQRIVHSVDVAPKQETEV